MQGERRAGRGVAGDTEKAHPARLHAFLHFFSGSKMIYRERERVLFVNFQER